MKGYLLVSILLAGAAIFLSGCLESECDDKCSNGIQYYAGDYLPFRGCLYSERPCETGKCDNYGRYCATPTPTPFTCEGSYPSCNGPCGNGTCRQPNFSDMCTCCGDGFIDQIARESCEQDSDCPFISSDGYAYNCVNCECIALVPTPAPTPWCGDGQINGFEQCEMSTDCSDDTYCQFCQCIPDPDWVPTPVPTPTATPTPAPTPPPVLTQCGNGAINTNEQCDVGAKFVGGRWWPAARDTCPENQSCADCLCVNREVTPRCGDCYISDALHGGTEDCDLGNNPNYCRNPLADTCPLGTHCFNCKCQGAVSPTPTEGYCGDGIVQATEQCEAQADCPTGYVCSSCACIQATPTPTPSGGYCGDGVVQVPREECESSGQCPTGYSCSQCMCVSVAPTPTPYESYCGNQICDANEHATYVQPATGYQCIVTTCPADCPSYSPSKRECPASCSAYATALGYTNVLGSRVTSAECDSLFTAWFAGQERECITLCGYSSYVDVGGCCVAKKHEIPCTDCPGQNPVCPGQAACPAG